MSPAFFFALNLAEYPQRCLCPFIVFAALLDLPVALLHMVDVRPNTLVRHTA